jgi:hypothetical protein
MIMPSFAKKYKFFLTVFLVVVFFVVLANQTEALSAPTITAAVERDNAGARELDVRGVVLNGSDVLIYAGGKLLGQAVLEKGNEGINKFLFKKTENLPSAPYSIQAVSREQATSAVSSPSEQVVVQRIINNISAKETVVNIKNSDNKNESALRDATSDKTISLKESTAITKEKGLIGGEAANEENVVVKGYESGNADGEKINKSDLENILNKKIIANQLSGTGLVTEKQESLGEIKFNLLIFIIFLMAVISWIIWVNRELVKEKQEKNDSLVSDDEIGKNNEFNNFADDLLARNIKDEAEDRKNIDILNF